MKDKDLKKIIDELAMSVACLLDDIDTIETKDLYHIQDLVTELEMIDRKLNPTL